MKIVGIRYFDTRLSLYQKPDSALLVNQKPFFVPDGMEGLCGHLCLVAKISRLGKYISERYASRYYEEMAVGVNVCADQMIDRLMAEGVLPTEAYAFDYSMIVGGFEKCRPDLFNLLEVGGRLFRKEALVLSIDEAVSRLSKTLTLRMGDMVAVDFVEEPLPLVPDQTIEVTTDNHTALLCRIK